LNKAEEYVALDSTSLAYLRRSLIIYVSYFSISIVPANLPANSKTRAITTSNSTSPPLLYLYPIPPVIARRQQYMLALSLALATAIAST
jgi:hypothetical protein